MTQFTLTNELMMAATLTANETIYSKTGSMLACQDNVRFTRSFLTGGGMQQLVARQVTNETFAMISAQGTGTVYYGHKSQFVTLVQLAGDSLHIESDQLLAFDHTLQVSTQFVGQRGLVQGLIKGAVTDQGLFTTVLSGKGNVAILSDGYAQALTVNSDTAMHVDPDAYIAHTGQLTPSFVTDVNWKTFIGQTSGESYQIKFTGNGTVYIQTKER